jgi:hypothetical protein
MPRIYRAGVWSGAGFLVMYLLGLWVLADFVPAHSPQASAEQIAEIYRMHNARIKLGMDFVMFAAALYLPWVATWSAMIRRMEGPETFLSKCQLLGGLASSMFFVLPALVWQVAAYRIERPASEIRMLNDLGWILTVTPVPPFLIQFLPFAAAILIQKARPGLLPRWLGYASLWACLLYSPAVAAYFFKSGPLAWNGWLSFWIPLSVFAVWESVIIGYGFRITRRNAGASAAPPVHAVAAGIT